jgi:hypothetical protein
MKLIGCLHCWLVQQSSFSSLTCTLITWGMKPSYQNLMIFGMQWFLIPNMRHPQIVLTLLPSTRLLLCMYIESLDKWKYNHTSSYEPSWQFCNWKNWWKRM